MTSRALLGATAVLCLVALASSASAQEAPADRVLRSGAQYALPGASVSDVTLSYEQTDVEAAAPRRGEVYPGQRLHQTGTALMAMGVMSQVSGALGGFFGLIIPWGGCNDVCGPTGMSIALFTTGMVTGGMGLVAFFVGLGLDIRGRVLRGAFYRQGLALTPTGVALTF